MFAYTENSRIENVNASNNHDYGICLYSSSNNILIGNTASNNNWRGIYLRNSNNNTLMSNTANSNNYYGIYLEDSGNNTLTENTMSGNRYNFGIDRCSLSDYIQSIDTSNTVDEKPIYYWVDQEDKTIPNDAGFVGVVNSTNNCKRPDINE